MRKITVMGSHLCPDTIYAVNKLVEAGFKVTYKDILSCHSDLREYLMMRDTSPMYEDIRGQKPWASPALYGRTGRRRWIWGRCWRGKVWYTIFRKILFLTGRIQLANCCHNGTPG